MFVRCTKQFGVHQLFMSILVFTLALGKSSASFYLNWHLSFHDVG